MAINPNMVLDFAQNLGRTQPLTALAGGAVNVIQQKRAEKAQAEAQRNYRESLNAYMQNQTPENYTATIEAGRAAGVFDQAQTTLEGFNQERRQQEVKNNMNVVGPLLTGDTELAMSNINEQLEAALADGDQEEASSLQWIKKQVEEGNVQEVADYLSIMTGTMGPEGEQAVKNLLAQRKDRRASRMDEAKLIELGSELEWESEADKRRAMEAADGLNMPLGRALMELGSVVSTEGLNGPNLTDQMQSLRKEYNSYVEGFNESLNSADQIQALVESGADTGMLDAALLDYFNRVSNPDAVVRQSDVARTEDAQGVWRRVENLKDKLMSGTSFTEETREDMLDVVNTVRGITQEAKQEASGAIDSSLQRMAGDNDEFLTQVRREVFGPEWEEGGPTEQRPQQRQAQGGEAPEALSTVRDSDFWQYMTEEEREAAQNMTEEELRNNFSSLFEESSSGRTVDF